MDDVLVSLSVSESDNLLDSMEENRRDVENLAMDAINSLQIPLLNSMLCLTKVDCRCILERSNRCTNAVEQSLLLIAVTDFMSCVCANNEMFPIPMQRCDCGGIKSCLSKLENCWIKFFSKINVGDMNANQLSSIMCLLKRCLERVSNRNYKAFMEVILDKSEATIRRMNSSLEQSTIVVKKGSESLLEGKNINKKSSSSVAVSESHLENKVDSHLPQGTSNSIKKKLKNSSCDITRFILIPCENQALGNNMLVGISPGKRKNEVLNEKEPGNAVAVKENNDSVDIRSPPCKKQNLDDDLVDGKVNAFKRLMMSQKKRNKKI